MRHAVIRWAVVVLTAALAMATVPAVVRADDDDPVGWSVTTDPRGRAFLTYVADEGGPRLLSIGCLRDVGSFVVTSTGIEELPDEGPGAGLLLSGSGAEWPVYGNVEPDDDGRPTFTADFDTDEDGLKRLVKDLLAVLKGPGPVTLGVANGIPVDLPLQVIPPRAGIDEPLKTFERVCFGGR